MNVRDAAVRAIRTTVQVAAGVLVSAGVGEAITDLDVIKNAYAAALVVGFNSGVISFLYNVAEDNTPLPSAK